MEAQTQNIAWKKPFFIFWISQAFSLLGSTLVQFGLVWWLTKTTGSASILATASAIAIVPQIVVSPFAGAIVDRTSRKKVMMLADSIIALVSVLLAVLFLLEVVQFWHIYLVMFVRSVGEAFHYPAEQASVPLMVPNEQLSRIAGLNQALRGSVSIIAPPLGALLLDLLDVQGTLAVDFITAFFAVSILFFIKIPQPKISQESTLTPRSLLADMFSGLRYIFEWRGLLALIIIAMGFKIALSPAFSLLPLFVNKYFNGDAAQYALVESITGIGVVAGGLLLGIWGGFKKRIWTTWFSLTAIGICMIASSFLQPSQFTFFLVIFFMIGFMVPFIDGPFLAILQANVSPEYQGRVMTMTSSLLWITTPIGLAIAGPVSDRFGIQIWYLLAGVLCLLGMVSGLLLPQVRNIES
jgi:MFS transporter, DHA3 family, macrolide efflux protein